MIAMTGEISLKGYILAVRIIFIVNMILMIVRHKFVFY